MVTLDARDADGFGFNIVGAGRSGTLEGLSGEIALALIPTIAKGSSGHSIGIFVSKIIPNGVASRAQNLFKGDQILSVNNRNLREASHLVRKARAHNGAVCVGSNRWL